jgi:hypothetical protein
MAEQENAAESLPGAPLAQFVAAVNAIAELRDAGKALVFLRATGGVSIIRRSPSTADILPQLSEQLKGEAISELHLRQTVSEIEQTISAILAVPDEVDATERLLIHHLDNFGPESKLDIKIPAHDHVLKKVQAAGTRANDVALAALAGKDQGRLLTFEVLHGTVAEVSDTEVVIRFDTGDDVVEQIYALDQFKFGKPAVGHQIAVYVHMALVASADPEGENKGETHEPRPRKNVITGDHRF